MSEVDGRANRREPMELYRPGALNEEREKHRRRAHFGENRVNNGQQQPQQHHNLSHFLSPADLSNSSRFQKNSDVATFPKMFDWFYYFCVSSTLWDIWNEEIQR